MAIASLMMQSIGLALAFGGSLILLRNLFISDEEIMMLSELPIHPSRRFAGGDRLAATDPDKLEAFRDLYLRKRTRERTSGRVALWMLLAGFVLQLVGGLLAVSMLLCCPQ
jgi:hypothetical protein